MFTICFYILLTLAQATPAGTVIGVVKVPGRSDALPAARIVLLPAKYTEVWNKQMQTRLDNYWEMFKPEFAVNKEHFQDFNRMAQLEAFRYITSTLRRDLGEGASKLIKESSPTGQFEFRGIPFGTYEMLVQGTVNGQDITWSKSIEVQTDIPIFVDLSKPVS